MKCKCGSEWDQNGECKDQSCPNIKQSNYSGTRHPAVIFDELCDSFNRLTTEVVRSGRLLKEVIDKIEEHK